MRRADNGRSDARPLTGVRVSGGCLIEPSTRRATRPPAIADERVARPYRSGVPVVLNGRQVFLASPSGLDGERSTVRNRALSFNQRSGFERRVVFRIAGWEDVPGAVGRPQETINGELLESDYLIVLLWDQWGSAPAIAGPYSSGTEEELFVAIHALQDAERPMRDVLVLFKGVPQRQLSDPGDQLRAVFAFRRRLEAGKEVLYQTFRYRRRTLSAN